MAFTSSDQDLSTSPNSVVDPMVYGVLIARIQRYQLLAKARWLFLALATLYCLTAGMIYSFSPLGWFLATGQFYGLLAVFLFVVGYNALYTFATEFMAWRQGGNYLQVGLDYFSVAALVYLTGGAASWFWPVTLLVTFEAAVLMTSRAKVFTAGLLGGLCSAGSCWPSTPLCSPTSICRSSTRSCTITGFTWPCSGSW